MYLNRHVFVMEESSYFCSFVCSLFPKSIFYIFRKPYLIFQ